MSDLERAIDSAVAAADWLVSEPRANALEAFGFINHRQTLR